MPQRAALYVRVSTQDQRYEPQLDPLTTYADSRSLEVVETYVDHGISGSKAKRPALDRLLADARRRKFDCLVVVKLDRLARSVRQLTELAAEFEALGVDLIVLDQSIDTSTPSGRFLFHSLAAVAELERDLIRERVVAGMKAAKRRGARIGRPRALDGHQRFALETLIGQGVSISEAARRLGVSRSSDQREAERLRSSLHQTSSAKVQIADGPAAAPEVAAVPS